MHGVLMHFPSMNAYGCKENVVSVCSLYVCHVCMIKVSLAFPAQGTNQTQASSRFQPYYSTRSFDFFPRWVLSQ